MDSIADSEADSQQSSEDALRPTTPTSHGRQAPRPENALSHRLRDPAQRQVGRGQIQKGSTVEVMVQPLKGKQDQEDSTVDSVIAIVKGPREGLKYEVEFESGRREDVSANMLRKLRNGSNALQIFNTRDDTETSGEARSANESGAAGRGKRIRTQNRKNGYIDSNDIELSEDDDLQDEVFPKRRRLTQRKSLSTADNSRQGSTINSRHSTRRKSREQESSDSDDPIPKRRPTRSSRGTQQSTSFPSRAKSKNASSKLVSQLHMTIPDYSRNNADEEDELAADTQVDSDDSDITFKRSSTGRRKLIRLQARPQKSNGKPIRRLMSEDSLPEVPTRRSGRAKPTKNMEEHDIDEEIFADEPMTKNAPKIISIREIYRPVSERFQSVHNRACDVCNGVGTSSNKGVSEPIYCQGCSTSIHKLCLGYRSSREHIVTKIGHENFIMQCRRCIGLALKKDPLAPSLDICQVCHKPGNSCAAFSVKKTSKQEERLRSENDGQDPITTVSPDLVNNAENILFRCTSCQRGFHFEHLPPLLVDSAIPEDLSELRNERMSHYTKRWQCKDCQEAPGKVQTLVAWRPIDRDTYKPDQTLDKISEDAKEYLAKWEQQSYFACKWMPGAWIWGVTAATMRKSFMRRGEGDNLFPKWTTEEAVPEEYLRIEIVLDITYEGGFRSKSEAYDKEHANDVEEVLVKFQGLGYDDIAWLKPPTPDQTDRRNDFISAYNEYLAGKYFKQEPDNVLKDRLDAFRRLNFEKKVEMKKQPTALIGGEVMPYQMEGLNWLLWNFYQKKNVILADEMGLGKTIQIVALFAALVKDSPRCWPFLVVTPNSTCPNWRREIKKWAPELRVVTYYGGKQAREVAFQYELFPDGVSDLRAHVVVTSYEAPVDESSRAFFRKIKWAGLVVDEGHRLKNDENLLYGALKALKTPFQVLLTGTPLQNNKRELFNLLQFLDTSIKAAELDQEYEELTKDNLPKLHDLIRPFFLRRTKLQVLKFLPPMAQVILPVSMSIVQKRLYKSILAKNPDLIKAIFGQGKKTMRPTERGNLNNILMQLRKCLCHPFLYSSAIEERSVSEEAMFRNLVDASSKFQLLETMLPKLEERGHRVLIFSQFLDNLDLIEDLLTGLGLQFGRLDGSIGALEKQKRIDAFNAPGSPLFAFLLSTRAGGVGINLATADTVIIMDPDFNPHQDIQALSRAHRIGQKKKVLVFQLMTKDSAEEKIVQIGRKKMALDHALIETIDADDDAGVNLESILKHGAEALFNDDDRHDIKYDSKSVDALLDRTQVENTNTDEEKTAESQFSYARVWANDEGALIEDIGDLDDEGEPNPSVWDKILEQRAADAELEKAENARTFGRGKRTRQVVGYSEARIAGLDDGFPESSPLKNLAKNSASDNDFKAASESDESEGEALPLTPGEIQLRKGTKARKSFPSQRKSQRTGDPRASRIRSFKQSSRPRAQNSASARKGSSAMAASRAFKPAVQGTKRLVKRNAPKSELRKSSPAQPKAAAKSRARRRVKSSFKKESSEVHDPSSQEICKDQEYATNSKQVVKAAKMSSERVMGQNLRSFSKISIATLRLVTDKLKQTLKSMKSKQKSKPKSKAQEADQSSKKGNSSNTIVESKTVELPLKTARLPQKRPNPEKADTLTHSPSPPTKKLKHCLNGDTSDTLSLRENLDIAIHAEASTYQERVTSI